MRRFSVPAETGQLNGMRLSLRRAIQLAGLPGTDSDDLVLAVDEAVANIIQHAYRGKARTTVDITVAKGQADVMVVIQDAGRPFDFYGGPSLDPLRQFNTKQRGGLGVFLIRNLADRVRYFHDGARNRLVLIRGPRSL